MGYMRVFNLLFVIMVLCAMVLCAPNVEAAVLWEKIDPIHFNGKEGTRYLSGSVTSLEVLDSAGAPVSWRYGSANEDISKLTDKNIDTKMCLSGDVDGAHAIINNGIRVVLTYNPSAAWQSRSPLANYAFGTANDDVNRDPKSYTISGLNQTTGEWELITSVTDAQIPGEIVGGTHTNRKELYSTSIDVARGYSHYKFEFTEDKGSNTVFQFSELALFTQTPDTTPNFTANDFGKYVSVKAIGSQLTKEGVPVTSGYVFGGNGNEGILQLADKNINTKMCYVHNDETGFFDGADAFTVDFSKLNQTTTSGLSIGSPLNLPERIEKNTKLGAYAITTANDKPERDPQDWVLYGSNDNQNWTVIDNMQGANLPTNYHQMCVIPVLDGTDAYRFYRMEITDSRGVDKCLQMAEVSFFEKDSITCAKLPNAKAVTTRLPAGAYYGNNETDANLQDGTTKKMCIANAFATDDATVSILFEMDTPYELWGYSFTTANDTPARDPASWTLSGSTDGTDWYELDSVFGIDLPDDRFSTHTFGVNSDEAYSFFKFDFTGVASGVDFQLSEIALYGNPNALPEPATWGMLMFGAIGILYMKRKGNRHVA